jgi:hypothetical protein
MQQSTIVTGKNGLFIKVAKEVTLSLGVAGFACAAGYYIFPCLWEEDERKQRMERKIDSSMRLWARNKLKYLGFHRV